MELLTMSECERWEGGYRVPILHIFGKEPHYFPRILQDALPASGKALAGADGEDAMAFGQWLAEQGLEVHSPSTLAHCATSRAAPRT